MEIAVLDLGSTTFHLQHVRCASGQPAVTTLDTKRTPLLGAQVFEDGFIDRRSWLESLEAVRELVAASRACRPDRLVVVATSPIRSASNGLQLVREIERRQELSVRVLDPNDEARLAYLGHSSEPQIATRRAVVIDLGGGSVEIAVGASGRCLDTLSLPIGAVRMRGRHADAAFTRDAARALGKLVREQLFPVSRIVGQSRPEITAFGSGSARAARRLLMRESAEPGKVGKIERSDFRVRLGEHLGMTPSQLIDLGVEAPRAGTVLAAATIMVETLEVLGATNAHVSDKGLRDGIAMETYRHTIARRRELPRFDRSTDAQSAH